MTTIKQVTLIHVIGPLGEAKCPNCGAEGLEDDGGFIHVGGSWDEGPFYWVCDECNHQWGHA